MRRGQEMWEVRRWSRLRQIRQGGQSGSMLGRGSGLGVELGGDQTSPVLLRFAVAQLGLEVEADEGMKNVVGQEGHQQECLDGLGVVFVLSLIHISEPTRLGMISYAVFC